MSESKITFYFDHTEEGESANCWDGEEAYVGIGESEAQAAYRAIQEFEEVNPDAEDAMIGEMEREAGNMWEYQEEDEVIQVILYVKNSKTPEQND